MGPGRLYKRGATWVLDFRDADGKRQHRSLSTNKREAEGLRAELIAQRDRILLGLDARPDRVHLSELVQPYLADARTRVSDRHVRNLECVLGQWLEFLGDPIVPDLKPAHVLRYRARLIAKGRAPRTANAHAQGLLGLLRWSTKVGLINTNPVPGLDKLPDGQAHQRCRRRAMTDEEIEAFLQVAWAEDEKIGDHFVRVPQMPMWLALLRTGCRYGELRQTTWSDLDEKHGVLRLRSTTTKSGKERLIPIGQDLLEMLVSLKAHHWRVTRRRPRTLDPLFLTPRGDAWQRYSTNINRSLRRMLDKAGIQRVDEHGQKIDLHALRHTFASCLVRNNVELSKAQRLLGHSSPALTMRHYVHLQVEELREAVDSIVPAPKPGQRRHG
jgi:integrase